MVSIRRLTMEDADTTFEYSSDFENTYYMLNSPFLTIEETTHFLSKCIAEYDCEHPKYLSFAVIYNEIHVGEVFASISGKEATIGWIINKRYWGKGISSCAAKALIAYLRDFFQIEYLVSYCDKRNISSKRVMEKIGMIFVGTNGIRKYDKDVSPGEELKYEIRTIGE